MFPIDTEMQSYNKTMLTQFEQAIIEYQMPWRLDAILPKVLVAGEHAGKLTFKGAKLLDPTGNLQAGIPLCPP